MDNPVMRGADGIIKIKIGIEEGNEHYYELARLTAWSYDLSLRSEPRLNDGLGNCLVVAADADGVARALGLRSRLCGGQVFKAETNEPAFPRGGHYWVVIDDRVIVDSPRADLLMIGTPDQRGRRYVPLRQVGGRRSASMRNLGPLRRHSDAVYKRTLTDPPPEGWPS